MGKNIKLGAEGHMGTIGVLMGSGGRRGPKNDKYCTQMGLQWERTENMNQICGYDLFFWLVGGASHEVRAARPNGKLWSTYGLSGGTKWSI